MPSPTDDRSSAPSSPPRGRSGSRVVVMVSGNTTTTYSVTSSVTASENGLVMYESDQTPTSPSSFLKHATSTLQSGDRHRDSRTPTRVAPSGLLVRCLVPSLRLCSLPKEECGCHGTSTGKTKHPRKALSSIPGSRHPGVGDDFGAADLIRKAEQRYAHLGMSERFRFREHQAGHVFPQLLREEAYQWFDRWL